MTKSNKKFLCFLTAIFSFVLFIVTSFVSGSVSAYAATSSDVVYTNVLDDLKNDSSFNTNNYPFKATDYSLKIIQIAESVNKELFVYVYQPSGQSKDIKASSINISTGINDDISFFNYKLEYLNSSGVFYKYKVKDFTVKNAPTRYYVISSIYRFFDETLGDKQASGDNTVTEVACDVSKQYCFGEINGNPYVNCVDVETIVVTDKFVGFVRYPDGFKLNPSACDNHFVAFNTDRPMDKLLEADVYYTTQKYVWQSTLYNGIQEYFKEKSDGYVYLTGKKVSHTGSGLYAGTYTWEEIQTVEDFISSEDREQIFSGGIFDVKISSELTDEALAELKGKKWVLRFLTTDYSLSGGSGVTTERSTFVGDVTILRLKFEYDGITYNLGTIDNKQSGGRDPSNDTDTEIKLKEEFKWILYIIAFILVIIIFWPVLKYLIRFILWILVLPFRLIGALFKGIRKSKSDKSNTKKRGK